MLKKIKNIILRVDRLLYKKFGSDKGTKILENIKEAQIIFSHLNDSKKDTEVRFVGGCVRKAICGDNIDDIDLATSLEPNEIKKRLNNKSIKVIDTGISHGTVTAIINKKKFEITTLRKDILTDGRHASVEFTSDWKQDALRRDFTINAIYADIEGRIFDPLDGMKDLKNGIVKFIGLPEERIQEDYLRILRYFRFFIQYSKTDHDNNTIQSIKQYINGINKISKERIFDELKKILTLKNSHDLLFDNFSRDIIINIFPQFKNYERLKFIKTLNKKLKIQCDKYFILALLITDESNNYEYFCHKYKVSIKIENRFKNISINIENLQNKKFLSEVNIKKLIYFSNRAYVKDLLLFSLFINKKIKATDIEKLINYTETCKVPKFPISGDHLKERGYITGKALGKKLKLLEDKWILNNFIIEKDFIEKYLGKVSKN